MVHPHLLALGAGLALLVPLAEAWSRYWDADPENWPRRALIRVAAGMGILAVVGFGGGFGLIPEPGVDAAVAWKVEVGLLAASIVAMAVAQYRRD